ncbi:MAG: hypothetical protein GWM92_15205 [Gemmatimonadetes bacterium]|nr:hypothetical protein [Gemmatimonadota bacterium]NIR78886.1 hypothetical protein [Gemmatimonadota bacterium]NIT88835.1 hypothetical protein [Gemmatimonadota bacterium]NIU32638.1 hypothetical protein [Gemmatimonadota bacterium]NIU36074.1 hypothetical protein [Gemmatimonadota bacterium]
MADDALEDRILRRNRALREMLELARGVIADGVVTPGEAAAFRRWLEDNPDMTGVWPCDLLVQRLRSVFSGDRAQRRDLRRLREALREIAGEAAGERGEFGRLHVGDEGRRGDDGEA